MKNIILRKSLLLAAGILLSGSLFFAHRLAQFADTMSVKYRNGGLTCAQIDKIVGEWSNKGGEAIYITGWDRIDMVCIRDMDIGREQKVSLLKVYGDMETVFPGGILAGAFVGKGDKEGCVISRHTAEELFQSSRVTGCKILLEDGSYTVRGVFASDEALMMVQEEGEGTFPYLELTYENRLYPASNTKAALIQWGLSGYASFSEGNLYAGLARFMAGVPIAAALLTYLHTLAGRRKREQDGLRRYVIMGLYAAAFLLIIAVFIKYGIAFSEDYIPGKISDFGFWADKIKEIRKDYQGMLEYGNWMKEKVIIKSLRYCLLTSAASIILWKAAKE